MFDNAKGSLSLESMGCTNVAMIPSLSNFEEKECSSNKSPLCVKK